MRVFVAVFPPPEVQSTLIHAARAVPLNALDGNVRWVRRENVHLTLKFLGEVTPEGLESVRDVLGQVAGRHEAFRIQPTGLGAFPSNNKARVLWSSVDEGSTELSLLAADVEEAFEPLGFGREERAYKPHVTLGRVRGRPARLPDGVDFRAPVFTAYQLNLVESLLGAAGAIYKKLESYTLSGGSCTETLK